MTDYTINAPFYLREYIWDALKNAKILNEQDYYPDGFFDPLVPIIPAQEIPEFNNLLPGKTYITYDYEVKPIPQDWWMQEEILMLTIISTDYDKITEIIMMLQDVFRRYDLSAGDINFYFNSAGTIPIHFHYTAIEAVISPEPFRTEGGQQQGVVHILYKYTRNSNNGRF